MPTKIIDAIFSLYVFPANFEHTMTKVNYRMINKPYRIY